MDNKFFVGKRVSSLETYNAVGPITGVALVVDENTEYMAGTDDGYVIEIECPYGTQTMADNLLSSLKGKTYYGYRAEAADLALEAELGDGIEVGDVYSMLAYRRVDFGPGHMSVIAAPGENELDHEYPYQTKAERQIERKIAATRSMIAKTAEQIQLKVETELNDLSSSIDVKLEGITSTVQGIDGRVTTMEQTASGLTTSVQELNGQVSTIQQTASGLTTTVQGITGEINTIKQTIQGVVYESSLADGTTVINGGCLMTNSVSADRLILTGSITFDDLTAELQALVSDTGPDLPNYIRSTYIASTEIRSPTITGNEIRALGSFQVGTGSADNFTGTGYMGYAEGLGAGDTVTKGVAISNSATLASGAGNNYVIVTDGGIRDQVGTNHAYLTPDVYSLLVGDHELRLTNAGVLTLDGNSIGSAGEDVTVTPVWG